MAVSLIIAYMLAVFLLVIGLILIFRPTLATGPRGIPLLRNEPDAMMAVLGAREIVLGGLAGGLAYTRNLHGLLLAFLIALIVTVIDAVALFKTKSLFGFIVNALVGLLIVGAACLLWRDLGSV